MSDERLRDLARRACGQGGDPDALLALLREGMRSGLPQGKVEDELRERIETLETRVRALEVSHRVLLDSYPAEGEAHDILNDPERVERYLPDPPLPTNARDLLDGIITNVMIGQAVRQLGQLPMPFNLDKPAKSRRRSWKKGDEKERERHKRRKR